MASRHSAHRGDHHLSLRRAGRTLAHLLAAVLLLAVVSACEQAPAAGEGNGGSCSAKDNGDGTKTISCDDGTEVTVSDGEDGASCTVKDNGDGTKTISCEDGTEATVSDGADAAPCTLVDNQNGSATLRSLDAWEMEPIW